MKPLPRKAKVSLKMMILVELVISWAMPRPAIIRISVATIGWIRKNATSMPFHRPHTMATTSDTRITTGIGAKL